MDEKKFPHHLVLENKHKLSITNVEDVDTFDETKIVLYTGNDTIIVEGFNMHIQKLDVEGGELIVEGDVVSILYTGDEYHKKGQGFFRKMLK